MSVLRPNACQHGYVQRAASLSAQPELSCRPARARINVIIGLRDSLLLTQAHITTLGLQFPATIIKAYAGDSQLHQ